MFWKPDSALLYCLPALRLFVPGEEVVPVVRPQHPRQQVVGGVAALVRAENPGKLWGERGRRRGESHDEKELIGNALALHWHSVL